MSGLRVFLLGAPRMECDGVPLKFDTRKNIALLTYLAVTGESHTRDTLITLLWPELDPSRARAGLRRNLSTLKKALGGRWLLIDQEIIRLETGSDYWSDVDHFHRLLGTAQQKGDGAKPSYVERETSLVEAIELYRGDFLEGFSLRDSPNFDEWQFFETDGLRSELSQAHEQLISVLKVQGRLDQAIAYAHRWLRMNELNEEAHRQLMQLYALNGGRYAAIKQYRECVSLLKEELGVMPEDATKMLFEQIKMGEIGPQEDEKRWKAPVIEAMSRINLPAPTTPFIGRQATLGEIVRRLHDPNCQLLTLLGPGGVGKTRLAIQAATELVDDCPYGVYFVPLAAIGSIESIIPAIASSLGFRFTQENEPSERQLHNYLRGKRLLIVLDNFEHLVEGAGLVSDIMSQAKDVKILTTSRERLKLQGEWVIEVGGMHYPDTGQLTSLSRIEVTDLIGNYASIELFTQGATRVRADFRITAEDIPHIIRITQLVEGVPLALELASSWVSVLSCKEIAGEIEHSLDFLASSMRDIPERQRSMRAVFDHSWALLGEREQQIIQRISVFRGGFSREAGEQVAGSTLQDLGSLTSKTFLMRGPEGRYQMHELLRQYAAEKLASDLEEKESIHDKHSAYYCAALKAWGKDLKGPNQIKVLAEIEADLGNTIAAWEWAAANRQLNRLAGAMDGLCHFLFRQARYEEGESICRTLVEALEEQAEKEYPLLYIRVLAWRGWFNLRQGKPGVAELNLEGSLALLESSALDPVDAKSERAFILMLLGERYLGYSKEVEKGKRLVQQSLTLYHELDEQWWDMESIQSLGGYVWYDIDLPDIELFLMKSLQFKRAQGDLFGMANLLDELGKYTLNHKCDPEGAKHYFQESSEIFQGLSDQISVTRTFTSLDHQFTISGRFPELLELRQQRLRVYEELGNSIRKISMQAEIGETYHMLGDYETAEKFGRSAVAMQQDDAVWNFTFMQWYLGLTLLATKKYTEAKGYFQESVTIYRNIGFKPGLASALATLGRAEIGLGNFDDAWDQARVALALLVESPVFLWFMYAISTIALLFIEKGEVPKAVELYALVSKQPFVANSIWFEDVYGVYIQTAAASLPPEGVEAAKERGRTLDLMDTARKLLTEI